VLPAMPPPAPPPVPILRASTLVVGGAAALAGMVVLGARLTHPRAAAPVASAVSSGARPFTPAAHALTGAAGAELASGLIAYWRFDGQPGARVARDSRGDNHCTLRRLNPYDASVTGVAGHAIHFNGSGYLECGTPEAVEQLGHALTVAGWLNLDREEHDLRAILAWQRDQGSQRFGLFFGVAGSKLVLASDVWGRIEAPLGPVAGRWIHVAATRDQNGRKRLFIDGVAVAEDGGHRQALGSGHNPLIIGGHIHTGGQRKITQQIHGTLDELALYGRALSPDEVAVLANHAAPALLATTLDD
jgi:hypothetical protein